MKNEKTTSMDEISNSLWNKLQVLHNQLGVSFPNLTSEDKYICNDSSFWTKGFYPGMLWYGYLKEQIEEFRQTAEQIEVLLDDILHDFYTIHHDAGFVWSLTSVANYKITGNLESKRRALIAASHLAGRFNVKGQFIRAWNDANGGDNQGWAIIDCCMNLPLLYWASEQTNDPRFRHIAMAHADTVVKEFAKADGTTYHIVCFDPETGVKIGPLAGQGADEESAWARGQAWIIYGMALSYRYTKEARYLRTAIAAANYFVHHLPEDHIPYWDFKVKGGQKEPRDTSASMCAACGLLELARYVEEETSTYYRDWAEKMVTAVYDHWWIPEKERQGLIGGGTFNCPAGKGIHESLIYGDYFFTEAVTRLMGESMIFW